MHQNGAAMNIFLFIIFIFFLIYIVETLSKREKAKQFAHKLVKGYKLQFLDDSIYCAKISIIKGSKYPISIQRTFHFYASPYNEIRLMCYLVMVNNNLIDWYIEPYHNE
jgi:hypothetical protein